MYIVCVYNSRIDMCDLIWYNTVYIYTYVYVIGIYIYICACVCVRARFFEMVCIRDNEFV
jgi:hypothetical protein